MLIKRIIIFSDGSVHPQSQTGVGAYLILDADEFTSLKHQYIKLKHQNRTGEAQLNLDVLPIHTQIFSPTSSTTLELETIIHAMEYLKSTYPKYTLYITHYTDSQNIISLKNRQYKLEQNNYLSKRTNLPIKHKSLYLTYYRLTQMMQIKSIKLKGHTQKSEINFEQVIFKKVDQYARKNLRQLKSTPHD